MKNTGYLGLFLSLAVFPLLACHTGDAQVKAPGDTRSDGKVDDSARKEFDRLYGELEDYRKLPAVTFSSRTSDHNDCAAFREILAGGRAFLPFVIEKIAGGDFFMNQAMSEMTGVEVTRIYPSNALRGEQEISQLWLRWWQQQ